MDDPRVWVAFVGTRGYYPVTTVEAAMKRLLAKHGGALRVVTGDADGVDACVIDVARSLGVPYVCEAARWAEEGRGAGHNRIGRVVSRAGSLIAFVAPRVAHVSTVARDSPGTADAIAEAVARAIPVYVWMGESTRWLASTEVAQIVDAVHRKQEKQ